MPFEAVPQAVAAAPYGVAGQRRRRRDPKQQRRQAQESVHLREKSPVVPILAVDLGRPTLPSEDLVDLSTAGLLERTHHHSPHHRATHSRHLDMLLRLARIGHIHHKDLDPREWALKSDGRSGGENSNHTTCYTPRSPSPPPPSGTSACALALPFFGRGIGDGEDRRQAFHHFKRWGEQPKWRQGRV